MNKTELTNLIAKKASTDYETARNCLNNVLDAIAEGLKKDGIVKITKFGTFRVTETAPREVVVPNTNKVVKTSGGKTAKFKSGKNLKEFLNN